MMAVLLGFTIKDWLIAATSVLLLLCILEIRKLKKSIAQEVKRRILPQLALEFNSDVSGDDAGFYLKNESFFLARDIQFQDIELTLDDLGYKVGLILKFAALDSLKPQEKEKLHFKVFDRNQSFLPEVTERIIPHLISISFKVKVNYSNIENLKSSIVFSKREGNFFPEDIEFRA